jgi:hypothetical protein
MFGALTEDERHALNLRLADWGHRFHEVGNTLAHVALSSRDSGATGVIWRERAHYVAAREEILELRDELAGAAGL